jgi:hypothetical protein
MIMVSRVQHEEETVKSSTKDTVVVRTSPIIVHDDCLKRVNRSSHDR